MMYRGKSGEFFQLQNVHSNDCILIEEHLESPLTFLWFSESETKLHIDGLEYTFKKNQIVCLTEFHKVELSGLCHAKMLRFNRSFYCIIDHDSEVSCKGILFFGAARLPILSLPDTELEKFETIWRMFELELQSSDDLQLEMLQSMLKRFIIMCTRLYKNQENFHLVEGGHQDLLRDYNFLVEQHFKTKHTVAEYAELLHKSPKTLSNIFTKISHKSPLRYIQERKALEARRLLRYSKMSIKEIAYEIGFEDIQTFGRFFKNMEGLSPSDFKASK